MPKKIKWVSLTDMPESCRPLLCAFNELFGLHHTNYVVRMATGGPNPVVIIQVYGRMTGGSLRALEEKAGCRVEVEALAPGYLQIMIFGDLEQSPTPGPCYGRKPTTQFLYRPLKR